MKFCSWVVRYLPAFFLVNTWIRSTAFSPSRVFGYTQFTRIDRNDAIPKTIDPRLFTVSIGKSHGEEASFENDAAESSVASAETAASGAPKAATTDSNEELFQFLMNSPVGTLSELESTQLRKLLQKMETPNDRERVLYRMIDEYISVVKRKGKSIKFAAVLEPTVNDFNELFLAWQATIQTDDRKLNNANLPEAVENVKDLFATMEDLFHDQQLQSLKPTSDSIRLVLQILSASRSRGMDRNAYDLFQKARDVYGIEPDPDHYHAVISGLAKSRDRGAAARAETFLKEAAELLPPSMVDGKSSGISIESFNVVLTAWAKSGLEYGPERAEKLIFYMDELNVQPSVHSFTSLIDAYAQTNEWSGVSQSSILLNRLIDQYLQGETDIEPNIATWTIVISAWARMAKKGSKGAPDRAANLLERMETLYNDKRISFGPDVIAKITVMNAYAAANIPDGPRKAQTILDETYDRYLDGDAAFRPTVRSIRVVIDSWVKQNTAEGMKAAATLLDYYEDFLGEFGPPDDPPEVIDDIRGMYRSMLFGWSKFDATQSHDYLLHMIDQYMQPDCFCYEKVMEANTLLNDKDAMVRSKEIYELMEERRLLNEVVPNERFFATYIRALTKGLVPNLPQECLKVLDKVESLRQTGLPDLAPTVFTYNAVLMACAAQPGAPDPGDSEAFKVAIRIWNNLRRLPEGPDQVSFANMLRCANLLRAGGQKDAFIQSTFALCCQRGYVNTFVVNDLQRSASEVLWRKLLGCPSGEVDCDRLPTQWRRMFEVAKGKDREQSRPENKWGTKTRRYN